MNLNVYPAVRLEYAGNLSITVSFDGQPLLYNNSSANVYSIVDRPLPYHSTFKSRRILLPFQSIGQIAHLESSSSQLLNYQFEQIPIESFSEQRLFHYYEVGFRADTTDYYGRITPYIYLDQIHQFANQYQTFSIQPAADVDVVRVYFNPLAYGFIPHIYNLLSLPNSSYTAPTDNEILWAKPVALPPRFYRGIRTHAEFQITYKGNVELEWFLDGESVGSYEFTSSADLTKARTEKAYFPSGTIGQVIQYIHKNPEEGGKVYIVETDVTLADLEQQGMRPQPEEG